MYSSMPTDWLCCAYLRKSREDEERERYGKGETLARHQGIVERMARDNGHNINELYREVVSGETIDGRPEIKRLLRDLASNKWDAVYVVEASRLGRGGGSDQEKLLNAFKYTNTFLISEYKIYDPSSPADMRQLKNDLRSSEDELESISTRLKRGKYESAKEGRWQSTGRTPYGWRAVRIRGVWQLEPDEMHPHMLRIYDMLEEGAGWSTISKAYNNEGVPTARGGKHWTPAAVKAIALNMVNCGYIVYGKNQRQRVFDPETFEVKKKILRVDDPPVIVEGLHYGKGGISRERWERITGNVVSEPRLKNGWTVKNPLAGLLVCGKCGYTMNYHQMSSGKSRRYFYTHKRKEGMTRECTGCRGAHADQVLEVLVATLKEMVADVEVRIGSDDGMDRYNAIMDSLKGALANVESSRRRAMDAYEAGVYSLEELKQSKAEADAKAASIQRQIDEAKPPKYTPETVTTMHECLDALQNDDLPAQAKNTLLKRHIKRIDYYNETEPFVLPNKFHLDIFFK